MTSELSRRRCCFFTLSADQCAIFMLRWMENFDQFILLTMVIIIIVSRVVVSVGSCTGWPKKKPLANDHKIVLNRIKACH